MKPSELKPQSSWVVGEELYTAEQMAEALESAMSAARTGGYEGWPTDEEKAWSIRIAELREGK